MHAHPKEAELGEERNFLSIEWAPSAASPLYEQEFQRGSAAGGFVHGDVASAFQGLFPAGASRMPSECAAERNARFALITLRAVAGDIPGRAAPLPGSTRHQAANQRSSANLCRATATLELLNSGQRPFAPTLRRVAQVLAT